MRDESFPRICSDLVTREDEEEDEEEFVTNQLPVDCEGFVIPQMSHSLSLRDRLGRVQEEKSDHSVKDRCMDDQTPKQKEKC